MIEIPVKLTTGEVVFKFNQMSIEQAIEWSSKIRARVSYKEALTRVMEGLEKVPVLQRNDDEYLGVLDKISKMDMQIAEITKSLSRFSVDPVPEKVLELMNTETAAVIDCLGKYLSMAFPTPEETKKS